MLLRILCVHNEISSLRAVFVNKNRCISSSRIPGGKQFLILIIHIIVSYDQNISLIVLCERWIPCQAMASVLCLHYITILSLYFYSLNIILCNDGTNETLKSFVWSFSGFSGKWAFLASETMGNLSEFNTFQAWIRTNYFTLLNRKGFKVTVVTFPLFKLLRKPELFCVYSDRPLELRYPIYVVNKGYLDRPLELRYPIYAVNKG